ncbi:DNA gyrase inhibitor YacG [Nannocystaceae bacterium ST9]
MSSTDPSNPKPPRCPTCGKPLVATSDANAADLPHRPFCSRRCKLADLGRWLDEDYRISRPLGPDDHE